MSDRDKDDDRKKSSLNFRTQKVPQEVLRRYLSAKSYLKKSESLPKEARKRILTAQKYVDSMERRYPILRKAGVVYTPPRMINGIPINQGKYRLIKKREKTETRESNKEVQLAKTFLDANSTDILEQIKREFFFNKVDVVNFNTIEPIMNNTEFIDLIVRAKIPFTSESNKKFADAFSDALLYLSQEKALGRGGNLKAGQNTIKPANEFALRIGPIIEEIEKDGFKTLQSKADELNNRNILSLRGKDWSSSTVKRLLERYEKLIANNEKKQPSSSNPPKPE